MNIVQSATAEQPTVDPFLSQQEVADIQKMSYLGNGKDQVICEVKTVFPITLFPTTLTIEKTKVNIIETLFFSSTQVQSILIEEIATVERSTSLFLGSITIHNKVPNREPYVVKNLSKEDATRAQRVIQGLMVSLTQKINIATIPTHELLPQLEKIGMSHAST
jgi:hypothetical protein